MDTYILRCIHLSPSKMRSAVPQLFLNCPYLNDISVSSSIDLAMCASTSSDAWYGGIQVSILKGDWWYSMLSLMPVHLMVSGIRSYVRFGGILFGGCSEIYPEIW